MDTLLALFIGLVAGIIFYYYDFKKGNKVYRSWYALTHKDPMSDEQNQGFVYNQPFSGKLYTAIGITVFLTIAIIITGSANIFIQLLYGAFILLGLMVAFYITPFFFKHGSQLKKIKSVVDKVDQFESEVKEPKKKPSTPSPEENKSNDTNDKNEDWRSGVKKFLDD